MSFRLVLFYPVTATTVVCCILMQILCVLSKKLQLMGDFVPQTHSLLLCPPIILWDRRPGSLRHSVHTSASLTQIYRLRGTVFGHTVYVHTPLSFHIIAYESKLHTQAPVNLEFVKRKLKHRARQLYKNISMLFLFPVKDGKLGTGVNAQRFLSCYG